MAHNTADNPGATPLSLPATPEIHAFSFPIRVYWEDTDAGGVVYHAAYVCFLERARTEWLRMLGVSQQEWRDREDMIFVVRDMQLGFHAPAKLDDVLEVTVKVHELKRASVVFTQRIVRKHDAQVLIEATVRIACLTASSFRPRAIPDVMRERFHNF